MRLRRVTVLLLIVGTASLSQASSASAGLGVIGSFGTSGPGKLGEARGIAVDPNTGDVYVADHSANRIVKYDQSGVFILTFGREVNETKTTEFKEPGDPHGITEAEENVCTLESGNVCKAGVPGTEPGQLDGPAGVAVDPTTGDVYVNASGNKSFGDNRVERFNANGQYRSEIVSGENGAPEFVLPEYLNGLAVDLEGNLYVVSAHGQLTAGLIKAVFKFGPSGTYTGESFAPPTQGGPPSGGTWEWEPTNVAVDANGVVYVSQGGSHPVIKFSPDGEALETLSCTRYTGDGLTINLFSDEVFSMGFAPEQGEQQNICRYGTSSVPVGEFPAVNSGRGLEELAYGPSAGKLYELYREEVVVYGTFPLPTQMAPLVSNEDWSNDALTSITLTARVTPSSLDTSYYFQYATSPDFTGAVSVPSSPGDVGAGFLPVGVSSEPTGLRPSTTYYYRVVVHNAYEGGAGTTVYGPTQTFTTLAPLPTVTTEAPSEVVLDEATVNGTVVPGSTGPASETMWCFQYGTTDVAGYDLGYVPGTPAGDAGQGTGAVPVNVRLTHLALGTTYRYRLVAVNSLGLRQPSRACGTEGGHEADGAEGTFTTALSGPGPLATSGPLAGLSQGQASLTGIVDPRGTRTVYDFQLGTDESYGVDLFGEAGAGTEPEPVSVVVSSLQPGTTYHYRLVASSQYGTSDGADMSFTTPGVPSSLLSAPPAPPLIATPSLAFPAEATPGAPTKKTTPKCKQGKKLSHGKCVKSKTKKKARAKKASRSRKER
jgi:hypothetical protein